eukprot:scaffold41073_cov63-Phaeocystis_antarctica.AAC.3
MANSDPPVVLEIIMAMKTSLSIARHMPRKIKIRTRHSQRIELVVLRADCTKSSSGLAYSDLVTAHSSPGNKRTASRLRVRASRRIVGGQSILIEETRVTLRQW